ncbi:MAG TPA: CBS domain-containing protein [Myxococcota bacterium]|nr:CBS domain-containing protein [Myxococcota bacterium]
MATTVKEWMSADPVAIEPDAPAQQALELMLEHGIRHLPVADARGRVVGVISIDDLRAALPLSASARTVGLEIGAGRVGELMTHAPHTVRAETPLAEAADRMAELRIGCLPVVESEGGLVGILSETDALRALAAALWTDELRARRSVETELDTLVARLRAERERIAHARDAYRETSRRFAVHPQEEAVDFSERAADRSEAESAGILQELAAHRLEALDRALERADTGRLALCERCGRKIPLARLQALPGSTLCIACARQIET